MAAKEDFRPETKPSEMAKPESRKRPHEGYQKGLKCMKTEVGTPSPSSTGQL
ncbi:hypothetical protein QYM36_005771 [Artemia franciscana]|uniref:Uncharacterized protein n=1 Tax=Artemia franciscana TaxID=6661 RepID=A0AA88I587_ARTSF|nr:hypothetical protein QYM36_005771 [Artemia franciscana]KAK2718547.1 hypothetical protein QYM36_005771 [Artemia franciscana]